MIDKTSGVHDQSGTFAVLAECDIDGGILAHFDGVVRELAGLLNQSALQSLKAIVVVDRTEVASKINQLVRSVDSYRSYMPADAIGPQGVALPLERNGSLESFVVIAREVVEALSRPAQCRPPHAISTIFEELLHVCVYGLAKERRGYVHPDQQKMLPCDVDLNVIASQMCDEYVVNRLKTRILGSVPLVQSEPGGPLTVVELSYGAEPSALVADGLDRLEAVLSEARTGMRDASDAWPVVTRILYRNFFEPLSRYSAYVDDLGPSRLDDALCQDGRYRQFLRPHWLRTHEGLQHLMANDLENTEQVLEEILSMLRTLLREVGVTYGGTPVDCWIRFREPQPRVRDV
jgi:hypothetical protein